LFADALQSADQAATWADRSPPVKNTLTAADAEVVEAGFRLKLAAFGDGPPGEVPGEVVQSLSREQSDPSNLEAEAASVAATKEASSRGVRCASKTIRLRDKDHLKFVSKQPRIVCGREPSDARGA
jgi:hypothetical protein